MIRIVLALGLAISVAFATGNVSTYASAPCVEHCADDDEQGQCALDCTDCGCCPHLRLSFAVAETSESVSVSGQLVIAAQPSEPQSPEPGDILHVPKFHLA